MTLLKGYQRFKSLKRARESLIQDGFTFSRVHFTKAGEVWAGQDNIFAVIKRIPWFGVFVKLKEN